MLPRQHAAIGAIASLLLYLLTPITITQTIIIFLASVLLDFDHYLYFIITKKDFSLTKAYNWFVRKKKKWLALPKDQKPKYKKTIFLFHGIEFFIILTILTYFFPPVIFILLGFLIHMIVDFIDILIIKEPFYIKFSQLYLYFQNKNKTPFQP